MASFYTWSSGNILEPATGLSNGEVTRLKQGLSGSTDTTGLYGVVFTGESNGVAILVQADAAITSVVSGTGSASDPITFTIPQSAIIYRNSTGWLTGPQKTFTNGPRSWTLPANAAPNQYQVFNFEDGSIQTTPWDVPITVAALNNKGWLDVDGKFRFKFYFIPANAGYVNVSGNGMYNAYNYLPDGGNATLSGSAEASTSFIAEFGFEWDVEGEIKLSFDFQWNVGQGVLHYYQIEGECLIADCDRGGFESDDPRCGGSSKQKFIQTIAARNIADLCRKMQGKFLTYPIAWPILKIKRHSRPAYLDDIRAEEAAGKDHSCNVLEDQDYENVPDCILFNLKQAGRVNMGMNVSIQQDFLSQTGSGSYRLYGNSPFTVSNSTGTINYNDGFSYSVTGAGGIGTSGTAVVSSSVFTYVGAGKLQLLGAANVVSANYTYVGSGTIYISGLSYSFTPTGGMTLSGAASILRGRAYFGAGSIRLSGDSAYEVQNLSFKHEGSGVVSLSGTSDIVSSSWKYTGDGGLSLFGSYTNNHIYKPTGLPRLQASGNAVVNYLARFNGNSDSVGSMVLGGSAGVVSSSQSYVGNGGFLLGNQAVIKSSWLGLLPAGMGITSSLNSVEVILSVPTTPKPLVSSAADVLTDCDCRKLGIVLGLSHNLGSSQPLSYFLNRNGFRLPSQTNLKYKTNEKTWRNNFNYTGVGTNGQKERWNIIFEWACSNELAGTEQVSYLWKFSMLVQRRNIVSKESADTRILCTFGIETECLQESFDFPFVVNTKTAKFQAPNRSFVDYNLFHDEIGLFKGQPWYKTPNFNVAISELSPDGGQTLYDYTMISPDVNSIPEAAFRTLVTG